jgi:hypothetical protein
MEPSPSGQLDAIERARYKLRQADVALHHLHHLRTEIAIDQRRAHPLRDPDLLLSTFFFSCLGLAKSAFYTIMNEHGRSSKDTIQSQGPVGAAGALCGNIVSTQNSSRPVRA